MERRSPSSTPPNAPAGKGKTEPQSLRTRHCAGFMMRLHRLRNTLGISVCTCLISRGQKSLAYTVLNSTNALFVTKELGYDEAFRKLAPGPLLVNYVLQDCAVRGTFASSIFSVRGWNGRPIGPIECAHIPSASCSKEHSLGLWRNM
jgi:hypothetical protein